MRGFLASWCEWDLTSGIFSPRDYSGRYYPKQKEYKIEDLILESNMEAEKPPQETPEREDAHVRQVEDSLWVLWFSVGIGLDG